MKVIRLFAFLISIEKRLNKQKTSFDGKATFMLTKHFKH